MIRVFICKQWQPDKAYHRIEFLTDDAKTADRWRRDGVRGHERSFVDYICYTKEELEAMEYLKIPEGVNDWSGEKQVTAK